MTTLKDLEDEIARIETGIEGQKKIIKKNLARTLVVETAEAEMRALHTRLSVLEANLRTMSKLSRNLLRTARRKQQVG